MQTPGIRVKSAHDEIEGKYLTMVGMAGEYQVYAVSHSGGDIFRAMIKQDVELVRCNLDGG